MSYDVYLIPVDSEGNYYPVELFERNYTRNIGYALYEGGLSMQPKLTPDDIENGRYLLNGSTAGAAVNPLRKCIAYIEENKESLMLREPDNGWGSIDGVLERLLYPLLRACEEYPEAIVSVSN